MIDFQGKKRKAQNISLERIIFKDWKRGTYLFWLFSLWQKKTNIWKNYFICFHVDKQMRQIDNHIEKIL